MMLFMVLLLAIGSWLLAAASFCGCCCHCCYICCSSCCWCCVFVLFVWLLLVWLSLLLTVVGVVVVIVTATNFLHGRLCQLPVPAATKANVPSSSETGLLYSTGWPGSRRNSAHCHEGRTVQTPRAGSHEGKCAGRSRVVVQVLGQALPHARRRSATSVSHVSFCSCCCDLLRCRAIVAQAAAATC